MKETVKIDSHYDYLDCILDTFWRLLFNKTLDEMYCSGFVGAHGDKGYGYKYEWEELGIPFYRGMLIYLLTYTRELGETPKCKSHQWVIDNYPKYLPFILKAETELGIVLDLPHPLTQS